MLGTKDRIRFLYLSQFSLPASDRLIFRCIYRQQVCRILEIGLGDCQRALRMIETASIHTPLERIYYTGIDQFEARTSTSGPGVSLKTAHRLLSSTGARIHLIPGDPYAALSRSANSVSGIDLAVVAAYVDEASLARAWFYFPRMLAPGALVMVEQGRQQGGGAFCQMAAGEVQQLAAAGALARAA